MTTLEFGLPNALLFPPPDADTPQEPIEETTGADAFLPTGLLLQDSTVTPEPPAFDLDNTREAGFGGTCPLTFCIHPHPLGLRPLPPIHHFSISLNEVNLN